MATESFRCPDSVAKLRWRSQRLGSQVVCIWPRFPSACAEACMQAPQSPPTQPCAHVWTQKHMRCSVHRLANSLGCRRVICAPSKIPGPLRHIILPHRARTIRAIALLRPLLLLLALRLPTLPQHQLRTQVLLTLLFLLLLLVLPLLLLLRRT